MEHVPCRQDRTRVKWRVKWRGSFKCLKGYHDVCCFLLRKRSKQWRYLLHFVIHMRGNNRHASQVCPNGPYISYSFCPSSKVLA